jgi:hypothetical protein
MSDASRSRLEPLFVVSAFLALSILATYPLIRHFGNTLPGDLGDPLLGAWILGWDADRLRHGLAGVWDAPILFPDRHTLAYAEHLLGIGVFVAPVIWATNNAVAGHNAAFLLSYVLAGSGMYLLARSLTGRRDAAFLAGIAFAFGPPRAAQLSHLQVLASGWMPIALWGLHRFFAERSIRALFVFGAAFAIQALSNGYFMYYLAILVGIVALYEIARSDMRGQRVRAIGLLGGAGALIALVLLPVAIAYLAVRHDTGFARGYGDWLMYSADLKSYVSATGANRLWGRLLAIDGAPERQLFPGFTVLLLSAIAVWPGAGRRPRTLLYAVVAAVFCVLSLGPEPSVWSHRLFRWGPYLLLTWIVPGFNAIRAPARLATGVYLSLSVLAAFGIARIVTTPPPRNRPVAVVAIGIALFAEGLGAPIPLAAFDARLRSADRPAYRWLARSAPGAVLELPVHEWAIAPTLTYQYATLVHRHPIVNGYSGRGSALQSFLGGGSSPLGELDRMDGALDLLEAVGIRYDVDHPPHYEDHYVGLQTVAAIRRSTSNVVEEFVFPGGAAFRLSDASPSPTGVPIGPRIDPGALRVTTSDAGDRIAQMFDSDAGTRWFIDRPQDGRTWIRIALDRPRDVSQLALVMAWRSVGDYPRDLMVESSNATQSAVLYQGDTLGALGRSIVRPGATPEIRIDLPPNSTHTLTIRQTGSSRRWWSIHELELYERRR